MRENPEQEDPGPFDVFLTERLAALREAGPNQPIAYHRMLLMKELVEDLQASPKDARAVVDQYLKKNGLAIRQPTLWECILTGIVGAAILLALLTPLYFFLKHLRPR